MCDCSRIGGVKTRPETERQAIERLTAENVRLRRQVESAEAARTAEIERLREALAQLMYEARAYIEPYGSSANPAMHAAREALAAHFNPEAEPKPGHNCDAELKARPDYSPFLGSPLDYTCSCGQRFIYDSDEASGAWWEAVPDAE